jgi:hypothetical protein
VYWLLPALTCPKAAVTGSVYETCRVRVRRAISPMVGEVVSGDRPADHAQPPAFPLTWGLRRLVVGKQVVFTQGQRPSCLASRRRL